MLGAFVSETATVQVWGLLVSETVLLYGFGTYVVLLVSWLVSCLPFHCLDMMKTLQSRRLQPQKDRFSHGLATKALRMVLLNWSWLLFAVVAASHVLADLFPSGSRSSADVLSFKFIVKVLVCFVIDDFSFYWYHRLLHSHPALYTRFHKPHHVFTAPFAWTSHAVHPVEMMLQSVGTMTGPLLMGMSLEELWMWLAIRQLQGVLDHTGYDLGLLEPGFGMLPWIFGGTPFHDEHHRRFNGNYASCFSFFDDLFGTRLNAAGNPSCIKRGEQEKNQ